MKKVSTEQDRMKAAFSKKNAATFGRAQTYAPGPNQGGPVVDPAGAGDVDTVPAVLAAGEYVLPADTVEQVGADQLDALKDATHTPVGKKNGGKVKGCADGGVVQAIRNRPRRIDEAVQADATGAPRPVAPAAKTIEQQTQEKVVQPVKDAIAKVKSVFGMADGGRVLRDRAKNIDAVVDAAAGAPPVSAPAPAAPAAPAPAAPVSSLDAQVAAQQAAARAKAMAEKPKGLIQRVFGMADGGLAWGRPGDLMDPTKQGPSAMYQARTAGAYDPFSAKPQGGVIASPQLTQVAQQQAEAAQKKLAEAVPEAVAGPGAAQSKQFGQTAVRPRSSEQGWSYQNGRIAMVGGGKVPQLDEFGRPILHDAVKGPGARALPGYTVQELPVEQIDYSKTKAPVAPGEQTKLGKTVESFGSKPTQPVNPARTAGDAVNAAKAAANPPPPPPPPAASAPGKVAQVRARVNGPTAKGGGALAVGSALLDNATTDTEAYAKRFGIDVPTDDSFSAKAANLGVRALGFASDLGDAMTFGQAGKYLFRDKQDQAQPSASGPAKPAPAKPAPAAAPAPAPEKINTPALDALGVTREAQERPAVPDDMRGEIVRNARPDVGQQINLGDYGGDGQAIFGSASKPGGKIDTFTGAGGGTNKATGYAPKGVTLGIKPGEVEKFIEDGRRMTKLGGPPPPPGTAAFGQYQKAAADFDQAEAHRYAADQRLAGEQGTARATLAAAGAAAAAARSKAAADQREANQKDLAGLAKSAAAAFGGAPEEQAQLTGMLEQYIASATRVKDGQTLTFAELDPTSKRHVIGEAMLNARIRKQQMGARFGAGPQRMGTMYDLKETKGTGPDLLAYLAQPGYSLTDIVRNGVNAGGVKIPFNDMTADEQEYVKSVLSKKDK